jgi:hypothetical protein
MKILPVKAELFHAYRRMCRHDEANGSFCNFAKAPNKHAVLVEVNAS